jgi:hypothetical protein
VDTSVWAREIAEGTNWRHQFGPTESPVVVASYDPTLSGLCDELRRICRREGTHVFAVGPTACGRSLLLAALREEALEHGLRVETLSQSTADRQQVLRDLAAGKLDVLAVDDFELLPRGTQSTVLANRGRCSAGVFVTAREFSATTRSVLTDSADLIVTEISRLEDRPRDTLAIAELLWQQISGVPTALLAHSESAALHALCGGPYPDEVRSLRATLESIADALISAGDIVEGTFRRRIAQSDVASALLSVARAARASQTDRREARASIVVEGSTDVTYLEVAADKAKQTMSWDLLEGCHIIAAGENRSGGAEGVFRRLLALRVSDQEAVGLLDNDDVGRKQSKIARGNDLEVVVLPVEFDRLQLGDTAEVEIEDLLPVDVLERFYLEHADLRPDEVRWRGEAWRIVPRGVDKTTLADWVAAHIDVTGCERLLYVLCMLRQQLGMPAPRSDLDQWREHLTGVTEPAPLSLIEHLSGREPDSKEAVGESKTILGPSLSGTSDS